MITKGAGKGGSSCKGVIPATAFLDKEPEGYMPARGILKKCQFSKIVQVLSQVSQLNEN